MSERVSPSRLATYLTCSRQYEYKYQHDLNQESARETERYINRGSALDTTLQTVAGDVDPATDAETIQQLTEEAFTETWSAETTRDDYPSSGSYEYDRRISKAAVMDYVNPDTDGDGIRHLQYSLDTETHLEWTDDSLGLVHGYADNIVETEDGLLVIDYKASYSGRSFPNKNGNDLTKQLGGEDIYPRRLKKWFQIAIYCQGVKHSSLYSDGDAIRFLFYGLIDDKDRTVTADGYTVSVSGKAWDMTDLYRSQRDDFQALLETAVAGLRGGAYDPQDGDWELIQEEVCEDCTYQSACGDYLAEEVRFS